jgi:hypothetical protein
MAFSKAEIKAAEKALRKGNSQEAATILQVRNLYV